MRKNKSILILLGILILLVGIYFLAVYFIKPNDNNEDNTKKDDTTFTFFALDDVSEVEINNKKSGDNLKFVKNSDNKTWSYVNQPEILVDNARIDDILSKMAYVVVTKLIEENPKDAGRFGFNEPNVITAKLKNGNIKQIEIGDKTPTGDAYYFRSSENNNIYTINLSTGTSLFLAKEEVYEKRIFNFAIEDIQTLTYDKEGKTQFSFYYDPEIKMHRTSIPMKDFEVTIESFEAFAGQVISLRKDRYIASASEASKYGFDNPSARFFVDSVLQKQTLIFGTEIIKNSQVYAMVEGGKEIFLVDISVLTVKDVDVKNMITSYISWPFIRNLSSLYVKLGNKVADCKIQATDPDDSSKDKYFVNGVDIVGKDEAGDNYFKEFYGSLISLEAVKFEEYAKPSGNADLIIEYTFSKDNSKVKFEFISKDKNYSYVLKDGVYIGALVEKRAFDFIAVTFNEMMQKGKS